MIGWVIARDGKYLSPHGYVGRADQAQWYRSVDEAERSMAALRKEARALMEGASVTEVRLPGEAMSGHYGAADHEYDPFGMRP